MGLLCICDTASAHPGGVNASGCHNNRKTGDHHCHGGGTTAPRRETPREPVQRLLDSIYFANCAAARAAGAAPLRRGDPGYRSGLDRDDDGRACE